MGRGLEALLGDAAKPPERGSGFTIPLHLIGRNPNQPRKRFAERALEELSASLKAQGVLQPVVVRRIPNGYELIAGERRWRAAQRAGLTEIPAIVKEASPIDTMVLALIENLQREDLNPMESAHAFRRLMTDFGLTQDEVANRVAKDRSTVANTLRLLQLPEELQRAVLDERLSLGHAKVLLGLDPADQLALGRRAIAEGLSVRRTEELARARTRRRPVRSIPVEVVDLEMRLSRALGGTRVTIRGDARSGEIRVHYASSQELDRLLEWLGTNQGQPALRPEDEGPRSATPARKGDTAHAQ
ncbi:MAG: ParB/RepB/Spo0J family partition protein [Nitrospirae bacterium]|nr:ParB/RepB/Spo0J family partition protein [Nitrospirota bacterium]